MLTPRPLLSHDSVFTGLLHLAFPCLPIMFTCRNLTARWLRVCALQVICLGSNATSAYYLLCYLTSLFSSSLAHKLGIYRS